MKDTKGEILSFWFGEVTPAQWFQSNPDFDAEVRRRFARDHRMALDGIYDGWMEDVDGALALTILFDQFPRNMYRGQAAAYGTDPQARDVASHALDKRFDVLVPPLKRRFFYLPFEHSEDMADQDRSVALFAAMKDADPVAYDYALRHREVISRFGRFPHRNLAMGRTSSADELTYLAEPNAGF